MTDQVTAPVRKAAVIGAGSMGAGIAAHLANAGVSVLLLDRTAEGERRTLLAQEGIDRQLQAGGFMHSRFAAQVRPASVEDDLSAVAEADWIIEAVFEDLEVKRSLYRDLESIRKPGSLVTSNTSTIPLSSLVDGMDDDFVSHFAITHFFNPPRHMKLVELVGGPGTSADTLRRLNEACDHLLGKTVVTCMDTPGFIANRIGNYWLSLAALEAMSLDLTVEEADAVMSRPFGVPRTGAFGLLDYVGLNLVPLVWGSLMRTLPSGDAHREHDLTSNPLIIQMIERGSLGRRTGEGFYRTRTESGERLREALDLDTGEYRPLHEAGLASLRDSAGDLRALCESQDRGGRYAWSVLSRLVSYSSQVTPDIASDVDAVDVAMRLGYNWAKGPFELADSVGVEWVANRLAGEGRPVPPLLAAAVEAGGFYPTSGRVLTDPKGTAPTPAVPLSPLVPAGRSPRVGGSHGASFWDLGEGVLGLEIHTKMNVCDQTVVEVVEQAPTVVTSGFRALVIATDHARAFSAGADLGTFLGHVQAGRWNDLAEFVRRGQQAWRALRRSAFPVVAAPFGITLGGGNELQMHCDLSVAHAELAAGLPEISVGIVPGWGGCMRLLERFTKAAEGDVVEGARRAFLQLVDPRPTASAFEAIDRAFLRPDDVVVMNRDRLVASARIKAVELADAGYRASKGLAWEIDGASARSVLLQELDDLVAAGRIDGHDVEVARVLARILSGGHVRGPVRITDEDVMELELAGMLELSRTKETRDRMERMLTRGRR